MTVTIPAFDYEAAIASPPSRWKAEGLHWHAYSWRGTGSDWGNDSMRSNDSSEITPTATRAWLRKNPRLIRATFTTPQDAVEWLREQWEPAARDALTPLPDWANTDFRFRLATYDLAAGNDVSWAMWIKGQSVVSMSVIGTSDGCH
jgi:hypothetical protein